MDVAGLDGGFFFGSCCTSNSSTLAQSLFSVFLAHTRRWLQKRSCVHVSIKSLSFKTLAAPSAVNIAFPVRQKRHANATRPLEDLDLRLSRNVLLSAAALTVAVAAVHGLKVVGRDIDCACLHQLDDKSQHATVPQPGVMIETYCSPQIVNQIFHILDANAQPDKIFCQTALLSCRLVDASMAHAAWHADQRVDRAKADTNGVDLDSRNNPLADFCTPRGEAQHGAGAARLTPVQVVLRVAAQARIAHLEAVLLEKFGDALAVCLLLVHAHAECLDATQEKPGVLRAQTAAGAVDAKVELFAQTSILHSEYAGHDVVVA